MSHNSAPNSTLERTTPLFQSEHDASYMLSYLPLQSVRSFALTTYGHFKQANHGLFQGQYFKTRTLDEKLTLINSDPKFVEFLMADQETLEKMTDDGIIAVIAKNERCKNFVLKHAQKANLTANQLLQLSGDAELANFLHTLGRGISSEFWNLLVEPSSKEVLAEQTERAKKLSQEFHGFHLSWKIACYSHPAFRAAFPPEDDKINSHHDTNNKPYDERMCGLVGRYDSVARKFVSMLEADHVFIDYYCDDFREEFVARCIILKACTHHPDIALLIFESEKLEFYKTPLILFALGVNNPIVRRQLLTDDELKNKLSYDQLCYLRALEGEPAQAILSDPFFMPGVILSLQNMIQISLLRHQTPPAATVLMEAQVDGLALPTATLELLLNRHGEQVEQLLPSLSPTYTVFEQYIDLLSLKFSRLEKQYPDSIYHPRILHSLQAFATQIWEEKYGNAYVPLRRWDLDLNNDQLFEKAKSTEKSALLFFMDERICGRLSKGQLIEVMLEFKSFRSKAIDDEKFHNKMKHFAHYGKLLEKQDDDCKYATRECFAECGYYLEDIFVKGRHFVFANTIADTLILFHDQVVWVESLKILAQFPCLAKRFNTMPNFKDHIIEQSKRGESLLKIIENMVQDLKLYPRAEIEPKPIAQVSTPAVQDTNKRRKLK